MALYLRWGSIASMIGGVVFPFAFLSHPAHATNPSYTLVHILMSSALGLLLLGLPGLYNQQKARMGSLGLTGILIACLGTLLQVGYVLVDGFLAPTRAPTVPAIYAADVHMALLYSLGSVAIVVPLIELCFLVGYLLLALQILRARLFPRWAGLLLVSGALLVSSQILLPPFAASLGAALLGLGFIELGYVLVVI